MGNLIDSVLQLLAGKLRNADVSVERRYNTTRKITCFEGELRQVFTNLISNALDAMPAIGGRLILETKEVLASNGHSSTGIQITIADNGHGIPPDLEQRIFEPFYTTKTRGTGLGLAIARRITREHGGSIRLESEPGQGTRAIVELPVRAE
jgi:signal transduction histidine kinase